MGLLIHSHRHHFRTDGAADLAAMLMVVERGLDFAGPLEIAEPEDYPCEWCGHAHARPYRGTTLLCAGCIAELDARGSEPRLMRTEADIEALCDVGTIPSDDHEDEADRWEGDE